VTHTISIYDLVVGDVIKLQAGDIVPADCVIINEQDLVVDESKIAEDELNKEPKWQRYEEGKDPERMRKSLIYDPFILSSSLVLEGSATVIVCCVGARSRRV
jgi:P-type Ca2+ transporter type 2C